MFLSLDEYLLSALFCRALFQDVDASGQLGFVCRCYAFDGLTGKVDDGRALPEGVLTSPVLSLGVGKGDAVLDVAETKRQAFDGCILQLKVGLVGSDNVASEGIEVGSIVPSLQGEHAGGTGWQEETLQCCLRRWLEDKPLP